MQQFISNDKKYLQETWFQSFADSLKVLKHNDQIMIGLSWWSSINDFYQTLKDKFYTIQQDIRKKMFFCLLDERLVSYDDPDSNIKMLREQILDEIVNKWFIKENQIILPDLNSNNIWYEYFEKIKKIDIGLFGVGQDWHTCSLFPWHNSLKEESIVYIQIYDSPKPPPNRITITKNVFNDIKYWYVFFMWTTKKSALENFLNPQIDYIECPAKLIQKCENKILISDINLTNR